MQKSTMLAKNIPICVVSMTVPTVVSKLLITMLLSSSIYYLLIYSLLLTALIFLQFPIEQRFFKKDVTNNSSCSFHEQFI